MPVASNPLLQAGLVNKASRPAVSVADKSPQAPAVQGAGFDQVMARQGRDNVPSRDDKPASGAAQANTNSAVNGKADAAPAPAVADAGNNLPAAEPQAVSDKSGDDSDSASLDANLVAGQVTDAQPGAQLIQAQAEAVAPVLQAAVQPPQQPTPPAPSAVLAKDEAKPVLFDPEADALADMPTLRLALEQNAQAKGTTSAHATPTRLDNSQQQADPNQAAVNTLANAVEKVESEPGHGEQGDKAFKGLIDDGLKDLKSAASDTRVDDFANRLASLTQAATPKTANAVPVTPGPLQQPLVMNQGAWAEGLVNRVMYLSSQSLKSADIQLEPAELGRLNIRVNVTAEQSTQIHFVSGHAGVRDTLDSQMHRLRDLFTQQGLAQPDVSVADQSRGQQQQQQAQQEGSGFSGVAARRAERAADEESGLVDASRPVEQQVVIGDSVVDYYA